MLRAVVMIGASRLTSGVVLFITLGILSCGPTAPSDHVTIDVTGGSFTFASGVTITVPAGAVKEPTEFVVAPGTLDLPAGFASLTDAWLLTPEGARFDDDIVLRFPVSTTARGTVRVITAAAATPTTIDFLPAARVDSSVQTSTRHFSLFRGVVSASTVIDGGTDSGTPDAGRVDSGAPDSGTRDSGMSDAGPSDSGVNDDGGIPDAGDFDAGNYDAGGFCNLPGSYVRKNGITTLIPGGTGPSLSWLTLRDGFCAHYYATVGNARQLRFAPGGELFVASPTTGTTGGGGGGLSAIVIVPDDNHDGLGDTTITYRAGIPSTEGMLFANNSFYYQNDTRILQEPYTTGQRAPLVTASQVANINYYSSALHWPKTLDIADDGTIFVSNGGDEGEACDPARPAHGGIVALDSSADAGYRIISRGLRNAMFVKCHRDGHNGCYATELARDYSTAIGGREKIIPLHEGDDWGFPCCGTKDVPYADACLGCSAQTQSMALSSQVCASSSLCSPQCSAVKSELSSYIIGDTPFGFDFIDAQWPPPWDHHVIVALHGAFGTWVNAKIVAIPTDPATGIPGRSSNLPDGGGFSTFASGWDDGMLQHGRPADATLSPDGRLFIANDVSGQIFWIAPAQ